jgi:hypothetical protein
MCDTSSVSAAQSSSLQMQIEISVLAKQQSAAKQSGAAVVQMIEAAAQLGKSLDTGKQFDGLA